MNNNNYNKNAVANVTCNYRFIIPKVCLFIVLIQLPCFWGCNKLVEIDGPSTSVNQENVYASDATATAVLTSIYSFMSNNIFFTGNRGISLMTGMSADEWKLSSNVTDTRLVAYYQNKLSVNAIIGSEFWSPFYQQIYICNSALEGLNTSSKLSVTVKQQLVGEAKFLRAYLYLYMVNLFGDVPLVLTTDYKLNSLLARSPSIKVYQQIVLDLQDAQNLLSTDYLDGNLSKYNGLKERVRPTKWAASALLSRVYLYIGDFTKAELAASEVINNKALFDTVGLNNVFLKNSKEAIWQLQPVNLGWNTEDARVFVINSTTSNSKPVSLSTSLLEAFEIGDARRYNWVHDTAIDSENYSYSFKFKEAKLNNPVTEYMMVLRLAEQYLIRAEARAQLNKMDIGLSDLNIIRKRASLPNITDIYDKASLVDAVIKERRVELFSELGQRWFDLKRTKTIDAVMAIETSLKGGTWQSYQQLYPLPLMDLQRNPNLIQNIGY